MSRSYFVGVGAVMALMVGGCSAPPPSELATASPVPAVYSPAAEAQAFDGMQVANLVDETSRRMVREALTDANVPSATVDSFFRQVDQFNSTVPREVLHTEGFVPVTAENTDYDVAAITEAWSKRYPEFVGLNSRITAALLGGDALSFAPTEQFRADTRLLFMDEDAFAHAPEPIFDSHQHDVFTNLYCSVSTTAGKNTAQHIADIDASIQRRGMSVNNPDLHLVSVYLHDNVDTPARMFVGHAGVAVPYADGFVFVEKLSFDQPYQVLTVSSLQQLGKYLWLRYDDGADVEYGRPVIMDNDALIAGYSTND